MTGVDIDGRPYKLVVARLKRGGQITAWWGPYREQDVEAVRERIAKSLRDDVLVTVENDRPLGGKS